MSHTLTTILAAIEQIPAVMRCFLTVFSVAVGDIAAQPGADAKRGQRSIFGVLPRERHVGYAVHVAGCVSQAVHRGTVHDVPPSSGPYLPSLSTR